MDVDAAVDGDMRAVDYRELYFVPMDNPLNVFSNSSNGGPEQSQGLSPSDTRFFQIVFSTSFITFIVYMVILILNKILIHFIRKFYERRRRNQENEQLQARYLQTRPNHTRPRPRRRAMVILRARAPAEARQERLLLNNVNNLSPNGNAQQGRSESVPDILKRIETEYGVPASEVDIIVKTWESTPQIPPSKKEVKANAIPSKRKNSTSLPLKKRKKTNKNAKRKSGCGQ